MNPLISVIIPIYNCENVLERCLTSVVAQTYKNLQIILINDGSTDKSKIICEKFALDDDRITLVSIKNSGSSAARNVGLKNVKGEYITFVDSDDFICDTYIERLLSLLLHNESDIAICDNMYFEKEIPESEILSNDSYVYDSHEKIENLLLDIYNGKISFIVPWGKLYKTSLFNNVCFPEGKCFDDQATVYKTYLKSEKIIYNESKLYFYYKNVNSISNTIYLKNEQDFFPIYEERIKLFNENNYMRAVTKTESEYFSALVRYSYIRNDYSNIKRMKILSKKIIKTSISLKSKLKYLLFLLFPYIMIHFIYKKNK